MKVVHRKVTFSGLIHVFLTNFIGVMYAESEVAYRHVYTLMLNIIFSLIFLIHTKRCNLCE